VRALKFTEQQPVMVPTPRPPDDCTTQITFTYHGIALPHLTPSLDEIVSYDSQRNLTCVAPSWREMGIAVACLTRPHSSALLEVIARWISRTWEDDIADAMLVLEEITD